MKGFVFVAAVALACCVTTCGALKCRTCLGVSSRADCLNRTLTDCGGLLNPVCMTTYAKGAGAATWLSGCSLKAACEAGMKTNPQSCVTSRAAFTCIYCCDTDGCVGQPGAASAARVSIVTMVTAALAVLLKNAAGF